MLKVLSGLPVSTYFSALKLRWLMDNVPEVRNAIEKGRCLFGTIDTWLIWVSYVYIAKTNLSGFCFIIQLLIGLCPDK